MTRIGQFRATLPQALGDKVPCYIYIIKKKKSRELIRKNSFVRQRREFSVIRHQLWQIIRKTFSITSLLFPQYLLLLGIDFHKTQNKVELHIKLIIHQNLFLFSTIQPTIHLQNLASKKVLFFYPVTTHINKKCVCMDVCFCGSMIYSCIALFQRSDVRHLLHTSKL